MLVERESSVRLQREQVAKVTKHKINVQVKNTHTHTHSHTLTHTLTLTHTHTHTTHTHTHTHTPTHTHTQNTHTKQQQKQTHVTDIQLLLVELCLLYCSKLCVLFIKKLFYLRARHDHNKIALRGMIKVFLIELSAPHDSRTLMDASV